MNLLLDTHILLWWLDDSSNLKAEELKAIRNPNNIIVVSVAVIWEIRIKQALGKLDLPSDFLQIIDKQGFENLPITIDHAYEVGNLEMHHRDPFDRMLIAQATIENLSIVTHNIEFKKYDVDLL